MQHKKKQSYNSIKCKNLTVENFITTIVKFHRHFSLWSFKQDRENVSYVPGSRKSDYWIIVCLARTKREASEHLNIPLLNIWSSFLQQSFFFVYTPGYELSLIVSSHSPTLALCVCLALSPIGLIFFCWLFPVQKLRNEMAVTFSHLSVFHIFLSVQVLWSAALLPGQAHSPGLRRQSDNSRTVCLAW